MLATGYRFRALTPDQETAARAAYRGGARARDLATAYDVSPRTILRAVQRAERERYEVTVGDHRATFEIEDGLPIQVTPWVPR